MLASQAGSRGSESRLPLFCKAFSDKELGRAFFVESMMPLGSVRRRYRRDRRKDFLLQENGYLVLRFLAEDVGQQFDLVLDAILCALSCR